MKELTQKEIQKAFKNGVIDKLQYYVNVDGKICTSEFTYGGLRDCQYFIMKNGISNKEYNIKVISKGDEEQC